MPSPTPPLRRFAFLPSRTSTPPPSTSTTTQPIYSALLRITRPGPLTSIQQSRSILHYLESQFGRINYFLERRHLPTATPSDTYIITIFSSRDSYEKALASSPLIIQPQPQAHDSSSSSPSTSPSSTEAIHIAITPTSKYNHPIAVAHNPFHGPYDIHRSNTTYQTLRALGAPKPGIADFQLRGRDVFFARRRDMLLRRTEIVPGVELGGRRRGGPTGFAAAAAVGGDDGAGLGTQGGGLMGLWRAKKREVEARKEMRRLDAEREDGGARDGREGGSTGNV